MVSAFKERIRKHYKIKEGIEGFALLMAKYLFEKLEVLENPVCPILDPYQEDRYKMQGYLKGLQEDFDFAVSQGIIELIN